MITYTLLIIAHVSDFYETKPLDGFMMHIVNPFTPTSSSDTELFRLTSRHANLWKFAIISYEATAPVVLSITIVYWVFYYPAMDWDKYSAIDTVRLYLEYLSPFIIMFVDMSLNAIVFSPRHFFFCVIAIGLYDFIYWLTCYLSNRSLSNEFDWMGLDVSIQIVV